MINFRMTLNCLNPFFGPVIPPPLGEGYPGPYVGGSRLAPSLPRAYKRSLVGNNFPMGGGGRDFPKDSGPVPGLGPGSLRPPPPPAPPPNSSTRSPSIPPSLSGTPLHVPIQAQGCPHGSSPSSPSSGPAEASLGPPRGRRGLCGGVGTLPIRIGGNENIGDQQVGGF